MKAGGFMNNICLLNDSFPPIIDGVANAVVNYAEKLTEMGNRVHVITPHYPDADDSIYKFQVIRYPSIDLRNQVGYMAGLPVYFNVAEKLKGEKIDILHSHCPFSATLMARGIREHLEVPLIMTYHTKYDVDIAKAVKGKLIQEGIIKAIVDSISACDEVWTVSRGAGENLRSLGYRGEYFVMENGVDMPRRRLPEDKIRLYTEKYEIRDNVPIFLYVGRMMWYKGIKITIDALAALKSAYKDFRMVFIGDGKDMEEIRKYAYEKRIMDKCIFAGMIRDREELSAWYCRADLFLFPSTFDTNGLVVREAAACSLASVVVKGSCAAEGITDNVNGILIDESPESLAVRLMEFIDDRDRMRRIGRWASQDLYISWDQAVKKAADRYETVIENYRSAKHKK